MNKRLRGLLTGLGILSLIVIPVAFNAAQADNNSATSYGCFRDSDGIQATKTLQLSTPACPAGSHWEAWQTQSQPNATTTTTQPTTTTIGSTTTQPTTTTTQPSNGAFLSYPHQSGRQSFSGSQVIANRSYVGFTSGACLTISNATNVWVHDVDFDGCGGGIFLINVSGTVTIENIRARNTGNGSIGSGQGNIVQFNNTFPCNGVIRNVKGLGGDTEDMISIFKSGGCDSSHPLIIENNHLESPLSGALAWSSNSGTCINVADDDPASGDGGHDIIVRNNTLLNCGAVGLQMNRPLRVEEYGNTVYGAARPQSNVGVSQWSSHSCSACVGNSYHNNQVFWQKPTGSASPWWISSTATVSVDAQSKTQDPSTPQVHVVL